MPLINMERYALQQPIGIVKLTTKIHENEPEFNRKIIMSDVAHFHLGGYINKQDFRIWISENMSLFGVVFEQEGSLSLIFFNEARVAVLVNGLRY